MSSPDETPSLAELRRRPAARKTPPRKPAEAAPPGLFDDIAEVSPGAGRGGAAKDKPRHPASTETEPKQAGAGQGLTPEASSRVWRVGELVRSVRTLVERSFGQIAVEGEISNWRPAASGHCYFTLKDGEAQVAVVLFRRQAALLRFAPKDGDAVRVRGSLSLYESRGQMQVIAETLEPVGLGALLAATQALKERLRREGVFARQRPLPAFPRCLGVVTSLQGAALRDILKVCRRRHAGLQILIYPAAVQGPRCAAEVTAGVRWFSAHPEQAEVVLVARGGGSWEDLHGFDDEGLARAIAACAVPVIVGVGHATDSTIADAAADVCAPTPSAAAEMVTAAQHRIEERVAGLEQQLRRAGRFEVLRWRQRLSRLSAPLVLRRAADRVQQRGQRLDELQAQLQTAMHDRLRDRRERLAALRSRVERRHPAVALGEQQRRLGQLRLRLAAAPVRLTAAASARVERAQARLQALDPLRVLQRGYALVYGADGALLRDAAQTRVDAALDVRLARGRLKARVTKTD